MLYTFGLTVYGADSPARCHEFSEVKQFTDPPENELELRLQTGSLYLHGLYRISAKIVKRIASQVRHYKYECDEMSE